MNQIELCPVCGGIEFAHTDVLWAELIEDWSLSPHEVSYINRQQGMYCVDCGCNLRSMALAAAILATYEFIGSLVEFVRDEECAGSLSVLEVNIAGGLSSVLEILPHHRLVKYPEYDMTNLSLESESFDLVVHSDTLEHVADPNAGLVECYRVLKPSGRCLYTVPIIVDRLSRSRKGLKNSYHGNNLDEMGDDYIVHTEFGADAWVYPLEAGFKMAGFYSFEFPSALVIEALK